MRKFACTSKISELVDDVKVMKLRTNLQSQIEMRCEVLSTGWQTNETFVVIIEADTARGAEDVLMVAFDLVDASCAAIAPLLMADGRGEETCAAVAGSCSSETH